MTKSYIVDPATGKLLTVQEWKEKAGDKAADVQIRMVAIVPDDGSPAFAMPTDAFENMRWDKAMQFAEQYKAPHAIDGSDGAFTLPSRKQAVDIRMARENLFEQLLEEIGAEDLLRELRNEWGWTRERYIRPGLSEEEIVRYASGAAWFYYIVGMSYNHGVGFGYEFAVRPVTLLNL